jgi:hypothetical protein
MNGAQIRVMKEIDEKGFRSLLKREDGLTLPSGGAIFGGHLQTLVLAGESW